MFEITIIELKNRINNDINDYKDFGHEIEIITAINEVDTYDKFL